ncbi:hypothetical protein KEM55_005960 [Ascosphaera atra]|nr:hypothetical protein KEM55_005960 [Ascosphaera atra]
MLSLRTIFPIVLVALAAIMNFPFVMGDAVDDANKSSAEQSKQEKEKINTALCPKKSKSNCTLTLDIHYWTSDGLFHMDAAVYDKNCKEIDSAKYIYGTTKLKGSLPKTISFINFTESQDKMPFWFKYGDDAMQHKTDNCTYLPQNHRTICPQQFKC